MKFGLATTILLAQSALCDRVLQAREAKVTAAAVLLDRRADSGQCNAGKTACGDGNGCCPQGSKCTSSKGVGMCADSCAGATLYCSFGSGINLCCQPGASCDYSRSVCTQHSTDQGGVWTLPSTTADGTPLPTAPVFSSTSGQDDGDSSSSSSSAAQSSQSSSSPSSAAGGSSTTGSATTTPTPTKKPSSGSALVASWSVGVLALVFGVMAAL